MTASTKERETLERYTSLHRAMENGDATDVTRRRLIRTCIELKKREEAVAAFEAIENPAERRACRRELARLGWVSAENDAAERQSMMVTDATLNPTVRGKVEDAMCLLFDARLRPVVLVGTMAFPILLAVVGLLTPGSTFVLRCALALVPALLLFGMLASIARHVLVLAIQGRDGMDGLPPYGELMRETRRSLVDIVVLGAVFFGPSAVLVGLGWPLPGLLLLPVVGFFAPLTIALRLSGAQWRHLTPRRIATAIMRITPPYPGVAAAVSVLLAPAVIVLFLSPGPRVLFTMAVVGPLAVVPSLMAARVLGLTLHYERGRLSDLYPLPEGPRAARAGADRPVPKP